MLSVEVIDDPAAAVVALEPIRSRLLAELAKPASAATLAARLGIARQKVNYHLRALEAHHLVTVAKERQWGGLTERLLVASASSYIVSPAAMGPVATDPGRSADLSVRQLSHRPGSPHRARGQGPDRPLRDNSTSGFRLFPSIPRSVSARRPIARPSVSDLTAAIAALAARYHDGSAPGGRAHRVVVVAHPLPHPTTKKETQ